MIEMLKEENVQIVQKVTDWVDAIHVALTPLVEQGYCEARYIDGIIRNTKKYGPYYVLCENLALLHASSSDGVIKKQIAVTVLKEPVKFKPDGLDVRILVTLAAEDSESHMNAMRAISNIFINKSSIQKVLDATSTKEIYNLFVQAAKD
ncbi:MAG: PTS sugar transporter subunit IIA [Clostridia bacterium]|nr:PTS sugar transporter subunit IIA [Clostridia bacterium]